MWSQDEWLTDIAYLEEGNLRLFSPIESVEEFQEYKRKGSTAPLLRTVEGWLRSEDAFLNKRREGERSGHSESGKSAHAQASAGGFANGRLLAASDMYNYWG